MAEAAVSLRPWRRGDAAALAAAWADPDIVAGSQPPEDRSVAGDRPVGAGRRELWAEHDGGGAGGRQEAVGIPLKISCM